MLRISGVTLGISLLRLALLASAFCCASIPRAAAQLTPDDHSASAVHGRVLNTVTNEPISRALVNLQGLNIATFTNDQGQFEFSLPNSNGTEGITISRLGGRFIEARKLGFLQDDPLPSNIPDSPTGSTPEVIIRLLPEGKIVGHIDVPGSDGDVRIQLQLLRREMVEGRETWSPQATFINWVDGEFRFFGLRPGTYKLITHEQIDEESMAIPGAQLYGYPPVYYPNTTDFSLASPIVLKAGETARVNLTVARKEYYRVRLGVENMPAGVPTLNLCVYPMGHHGPGWSLGYNPREGTIDGILPDGNYTVEANTIDESLFGILNFSVKGKRLEGPSLTLSPAATISVRVHEDFQSSPSNFGAQATAADNPQAASHRYANVNVTLVPLDDLATPHQNSVTRMPNDSQGQELIVSNVRPGRYQVDVNAGTGYVASIQSGGRDLSRQPLVVGLGSEVPPIEITLRDNGAQLTGSLEEENNASPSGPGAASNTMRVVYLLPLFEGGRPRNVQAWQGNFRIDQLPAGNYLVVAFDRMRQDLPSGPGEAMQRLSSKGQVIHVEPGEKVSVRVKVIPGEAE